METLSDKSSQIQSLLLSVPSLFSNVIHFHQLPNTTKREMLRPISKNLDILNITIDDMIEILNTYSRNINIKNINSECEEIRQWVIDQQNPNNGSWPLAQKDNSNVENAWATSICILSLLKFRYYYKVHSAEYDGKILNAIKWLLNPKFLIYIYSRGWKQYSTDHTINIYDASITLRAIFKYRSAFPEKYKELIDDNEIIRIVENILDAADTAPFWPDKLKNAQNYNKKDIGATSYALTTLMHFYTIFDSIDKSLKSRILGKIISTTRWLINNYHEDFGWKRSEDIQHFSFEISCYSTQALSRCYRFFSQNSILEDINRIKEILISEIMRIQNLLVYQDNNWGWLEEKIVDEKFSQHERQISITNTALATSTLLKCCYKTELILDFSNILKAMNCLLGSFNKDRNTLENTYILCAVTDYLLYRIDKNLIF